MSKDRRFLKWQELSDEEKRFIKVLDRRDVSDDEIKALIDALRDRQPPTQNFYNHTSDKGIDGVILRLFHPGGGTAYALSYHPQKWAESLSGGEKPHIALIGHYHKTEYLFYRNIHIYQGGTFQMQTPYMRRKKLSAHLGGWVVWLNDEEPIGMLSDTHIGSKYWRPDLLEKYYQIAVEEGVHRFYHAGDIVDGERIYRGQVYDLYAHGHSAQVDAVVDEYPRLDDVVTYYILGNHDLSFWKTAGADISREIGDRRDDLICLGHEEADIKIASDSINKIKSMFIPFY